MSGETVWQWMLADWEHTPLIVLTTLFVFLAMTIGIRLTGLRSLSKMSSTDFVSTVALGSIMAAAVVSGSPSMAQTAAALAAVFLLKWSVAKFKGSFDMGSKLLDNAPVYLMRGSRIIEQSLEITNVSRSQLHAKLREANVWSYQQVICVVFESTGDISVLHKPEPDAPVDDEIFDDVQVRRDAAAL